MCRFNIIFLKNTLQSENYAENILKVNLAEHEKEKIFPNTINFFGQNKVTDEKISAESISIRGLHIYICISINPLGSGAKPCRKGEKMKRKVLIAAAALSAVLALTGCGRADNNTNSNGGMSSTTSNSSQATTQNSESSTNGNNGNANGNNNSETKNDNNETTRTTGDIDGDGFIEDIVTDAGDIVNDVVTGAEDIVDDVL